MTSISGSAEEVSQKLDVDYLYSKISQAMIHFDRLFGNVVTISKDAHDQRAASTVLVDNSAFSVDQNEAIVQFSGYLLSVFSHIQSERLKRIHEQSIMKDIDVVFDSQHQHEETVTKLRKRISLLQDMLVQEINKAEKLEVNLRNSESELLAATDVKNDLQKKFDRLQKRIGTGASNIGPAPMAEIKKEEESAENSSNDENPCALVGKYVRKLFDKRKYFGVITSYEFPFYMVIYEDGDREEVDSKEMKEIFWEETVPTSNKNLLARHEKLYLEANGKNTVSSSSANNSSRSTLSSSEIHGNLTHSSNASGHPSSSEGSADLSLTLRTSNSATTTTEASSSKATSRDTSIVISPTTKKIILSQSVNKINAPSSSTPTPATNYTDNLSAVEKAASSSSQGQQSEQKVSGKKRARQNSAEKAPKKAVAARVLIDLSQSDD